MFTAKDGTVDSRAASGIVINAIATKLPELLGGSADLTGSNQHDHQGGAKFLGRDTTPVAISISGSASTGWARS